MGDLAAYGRKSLDTTASMEKSVSPEVVSSREYYFNCVLFIKLKLMMVSKMANWIEGKGNTDWVLFPPRREEHGFTKYLKPGRGY